MTITLLNTRPIAQSNPLKEQIETAGAFSVPLPLLEIRPTSKESWHKKCPNLAPDLIIFISTNAVNYAIEPLKKCWSHLPPILAIGPATQKALADHQVTTTCLPHDFNSEALIEHALLNNIKGKTLLLVKGVGGRRKIKSFIRKKQAMLIELEVYERCCPKDLTHQIKKTWLNDKINLIIIHSIEAMTNLLIQADSNTLDIIKKTTFLVLSERIKKHALTQGIKNIDVIDKSIEKSIHHYIKYRTLT